jgi:beta-lactam-binding protein with PASTA domain
MKRILDWFQSHLIAKHLALAVVAALCLVAIAYYAMDFGTRHSARRVVPSFVGLAMDDAEHFADRRDLEVVVNDSLYVASYPGGVVLEQHPVEGTVVKPGRKIYVTISSMSQRKAVVPFVANRTLRQALNMLETAGFAIERIDYVPDMATNYVLGEYVGNNEIVQGSTFEAIVGSGVVLKVGVSAKATSIAVPQLTGLTIFEAKNRIWESGLNVGDVAFDQGIPAIERSNAKVYFQS